MVVPDEDALLNSLTRHNRYSLGMRWIDGDRAPGTTFEDRQPRWCWTGTWRGSGGSVFNIVQKGDQWVASGEVSGVARLYGNRAVGRATGGVVVPRTFDVVLSDDGMYAKGTVAMLGTTIPEVLTRISGPPDALANGTVQSETSPDQVKPGEQNVVKSAPPTPAISPSGREQGPRWSSGMGVTSPARYAPRRTTPGVLTQHSGNWASTSR